MASIKSTLHMPWFILDSTHLKRRATNQLPNTNINLNMSVQEEYEQHVAEDSSFESRMAEKIFDKMKDHITTQVEATLEDNKREIAQWGSAACSSSIKEITAGAMKEQRRLTLKRKSNQKQLECILEVKEAMQGATAALVEKDVELAQGKLIKGMKIIDKRIKAIKLADREALGWAVVKHYESDALASDSDDEKHIDRARKVAAKEARENSQKRNAKSNKRSDSSYKYSSPYTRETRTPSARGKNTLCFACNKYGHMQKDCFFMIKNMGKKKL